MLTEVQATAASGDILSMVLREISSGIVTEEVEGLDPVKATIVSTSTPNAAGEQYMASKRDARDIKFTLGLEPDYISEMPEDVRNRLYKWFMPNTFVDLKFINENGISADIRGMTETFEAPLFVQEPKATISVRCFDSDFVDENVESISGNTVSNTLMTTEEYLGTVESPVDFFLFVNRDVDEFSIYQNLPGGYFRQINFAWPLHSGDTVKISSTPGEKGVTLTRAGVTSSLLYAMDSTSSWFNFYPGVNEFRVYATGAAIPYYMTYSKRYGGL
jgi:Phage tail protein.